MTEAEINELARVAIAQLEIEVAAYTATDNGDGTITLHIYGGGVVVWPPATPPPHAYAETTLPTATPLSSGATLDQPVGADLAPAPRPRRRKTT